MKYLQQFVTTSLNVGGGIDASQTTGIVLQSLNNVDATKPSVACVTWADPLSTSVAEWVTYTSINSTTNELRGVVRGAEGYSAKTHSNGAVVAFPLSKAHVNELNDAVLEEHNQDGTHSIANIPDIKAYVDNGYHLKQTLYITSTTDFEKGDYTWLRAIRARVVGGGGGGGGVAKTANQAGAAGAGGGGGYSEEFITDITGMDATVTATVGVGGAGGAAGNNNGSAGGTSSFGTYLQATGGGAGNGEASSTTVPFNGSVCGTGGVGSDGDVNLRGSSGLIGSKLALTSVASSMGGGTYYAQPTAQLLVGNLATNGVGGNSFGGGGRGGVGGGTSSTSPAGGDGADGVVILELFA
jgi:hypothetical protein